MIDYLIIPECYVDTNMIETFVPTQHGYNHQKGSGSVARLMQSKLRDSFALGIIDKDKSGLKYITDFEIVIHADDLYLLRHKKPEKHHYLILIEPAVEKWIIKNAVKVGILLEDFGLSADLKELTKKTKKITSKKNPEFKKLFIELKNHNIYNINILSTWINYLKEHSYQANLQTLKTLTEKHV